MFHAQQMVDLSCLSRGGLTVYEHNGMSMKYTVSPIEDVMAAALEDQGAQPSLKAPSKVPITAPPTK